MFARRRAGTADPSKLSIPARYRACQVTAEKVGGHLEKNWFYWLCILTVLSLCLRICAILVFEPALESDYFAYFEMAKGLVENGDLHSPSGLSAFFSPGYPLFLAVPFSLFGTSVEVAQMVNVFLGVASTLLVFWCTRQITGNFAMALTAIIVYLAYPASYVYTAYVAKENLSSPLLLAQLFTLLRLQSGYRPLGWASAYGLLSGFQLLTTPSAMLINLVALPILLGQSWGRRWDGRPLYLATVAFVFAISPWLVHTYNVFGKPIITTNAGFNLYIGNNPNSTGYFVSISDTPAGATWHENLKNLGEVGATDKLKREAIDYMLAHPLETSLLTLKKLAVFWTPPFHEGRDGNRSTAEAIVRLFWGVYFVSVMCLFFVQLSFIKRWNRSEFTLFFAILSFWLLHGAAYIVFRYREPVMPLVIVAATLGLCALCRAYLIGPWKHVMEASST